MGKTAVLTVFALSVLLSIVLPNIHRMSSAAVANLVQYSNATRSHNIAVSAANMAANRLFLDTTWRTGYTNVPFDGGKFSVRVQQITANGMSQTNLTATGVYQNDTSLIVVLAQPMSFARFAYYSVSEGGDIVWTTGDTINGPFHTQDVMQINGSPVFNGSASARREMNPSSNHAVFNGGYRSGVDISLPTSLASVSAAAGRIFSPSAGDVYITINNNMVTWHTDAPHSRDSTLPLSAFAPNGVAVVANGNVHLGASVLQGQLTLCALGNGNGAPHPYGKGNIWIDGDVTYRTDPRTKPSTDMLGLLCDNNVVITNNTANNNNCTVDAAIFCRTGGVTAEDYASRPVSGKLTILGGITQYERGAVGTVRGTTIQSGFIKNYVYDARLNIYSPPADPLTGRFQIVSWLE